MSDRVLHVVKDGPPPPCPECNVAVEGYSVEAEEFWTLKPEYRGIVGLPVGPEYGERHVARNFITLIPCQHQVDSLMITAPSKPPDPLSVIQLDSLYEATSRCTRCDTYIGIVENVEMTLAELVSAAKQHLKSCSVGEQ
jgi:hypothetical protein